MHKIFHLSYAMKRLYVAVHRAQHAHSPSKRAQAARWAGAWNAFIQSGLAELNDTGAKRDLLDDFDLSPSATRTLH